MTWPEPGHTGLYGKAKKTISCCIPEVQSKDLGVLLGTQMSHNYFLELQSFSYLADGSYLWVTEKGMQTKTEVLLISLWTGGTCDIWKILLDYVQRSLD